MRCPPVCDRPECLTRTAAGLGYGPRWPGLALLAWAACLGLASAQEEQAAAPSAIDRPASQDASLASQEASRVQPSATTVESKDEKDRVASQVSNARQVVLNFRDEDWLPALEWLAKELNLNLDWQTLPEGKLSLFSANSYTLDEAEDQINMQLLARGFTLLKRGDVLRLVPMKDIDITLVPRVAPEELDGLQNHQVARVSVPLEWMVAEQAAKEFKPLLSPHGQMFPLASSNRLEVLDAVVNLRELVRLVARAESDDGRRMRVMEFRLKYRKAAEIAVQVRQLVGLPPDGTPAPSTQTQLEIEQAKFRAEAVKQLGTNARDLIGEKRPDTFLVVNEKENSIVVNAPPDKLDIVKQTIETLDKPIPEGESSWQTVNRVKVHPVNGFDPETISRLLLALQERGNLSKETRIQHEAAYNRIIAFATPEDHLTIAQLIESYRAEKRSAAVIELTHISPHYAVKAVQLILKNPERPSSSPGVASDGKFQIEADPEHNRLLLWASAEELKEVREFLDSLGESFDARSGAASANAARSQMHVVDVAASDVAEVTERLKRVWHEVSDSPLVIQRKPQRLPPAPGSEDQTGRGRQQSRSGADQVEGLRNSTDNEVVWGETAASTSGIRLVSSSNDEPSSNVQPASHATAGAGDQDAVGGPGADGSAADVQTQNDGPPPVRIIEGKKGDLVILSRDADAARSAKELLEQLVPDPGDVRVITLKYAQAMSVRRQLEEMLAHTSAAPQSKLAAPQPPVTIEVDSRTNRLIIQHCTARQLELISQYVPVLDQPTPDQERMTRQQKVYRVKYRRANEVVEVIKEVYRDLLSSNDRAYSSYNSYRPSGYNKNLAATATNPEYQGLMAVGADAEANLIVISAPGYLIDEVIKLAESVDTEIDGPAMAVISATGDTGDSKMREALSKILRKR